MRKTKIDRNTRETSISLSLNLDGSGLCDVRTGCGFLDHMLTLFASHGRFDLTVHCTGDVQVDDHHTVEDIGICLGQALDAALGDKKGICRYGSCILPMDESLILTAVDLSGRSYLGFELPVPTEKIGSFDSELVEEFFLAFVRHAKCTLHVRKLSGTNSHHIVEGAFKSFARSLRAAVAADERAAGEIPSTKGAL